MTTLHPGGGGILTAPSMIMEMELTAQDVTQPFLPDDRWLQDLRRSTPVGELFTVTAELLEVDGRKLLFRMEARNAREVIGEVRCAAQSFGGGVWDGRPLPGLGELKHGFASW